MPSRKGCRSGKFKPSDEDKTIVKVLLGSGFTVKKIASYLKISERSMYKHFREEIDIGHYEMEIEAVGQLAQGIKSGNMSAVFFYLKTRCGWRETNRHEHSGPDGAPIPVNQLPINAAPKDAAEAAKIYMSIMNDAN